MKRALSIHLTRELLDQALVPVGLAPNGGVLIGAGLTKSGDLVFTFTREDFPEVPEGAEPRCVGGFGDARQPLTPQEESLLWQKLLRSEIAKNTTVVVHPDLLAKPEERKV